MDCSHHVVQVLEFNALGAAVSCLNCRSNWQMSPERITRNWHGFESTEFPGKDKSGNLRAPLTLMVRRSFLRGD